MSKPSLATGPFLMGDELTLADPYLFVIAGWTDKLHRARPLAEPERRFASAMLERPSVRHVLRFEGLLRRGTPRARAPAQ